MNNYFVNIASTIGNPPSGNGTHLYTDDEFCKGAYKKHENHPSVKTIRAPAEVSENSTIENLNNFYLDRVTFSRVDKIMQNIDLRKSTGYDQLPP